MKEPHTSRDSDDRRGLSDLSTALRDRVAELEARVLELDAERARLQRCSDEDRTEKEWFAAVLNSISEEVYFTDIERRYTYANPAALREFGHASVAGVPLESIVAKLEVLRSDGTRRPLEEAPPLRALAGEIVRDEEQIVRVPRTGELRHREVSSAPVRNAHGKIIGSVSVVRDVTEQRRMNAELKAADRRKDEFIAMLAHELRNPLVPIRAGVELLKSSKSRSEIIDVIRPMMERQVANMVRLIDDLLDVSRITAGKIELKPQWVTIASLVGNAIEANRMAMTEGALDLTLNLAEPNQALFVDPTRFTQVISNLLQNATKFTPLGGHLAISAAVMNASDTGAPQLVLTVSDSGIGISPEMLPRVFDLFVQSHEHRDHDKSGLGIGLTLSRRLVEMHGGTIEAHSPGLDRGSTFTIRVPVPSSERAEVASQEPSPPSLAGIRILVVDDNHDAADAMALQLEAAGGVVQASYDGASSLAALEAFRPAVVLLDIGMPGMDGYETCRRMRARLGGAVGIVALSGWGQKNDKRLAADAGFDAHLTKPAGPRSLEETIRTLARGA